VQASRESLLRMARESATTFDALTVPGARAPFELHLRLAVEETTATAPNVAALWPGSDPERRGELLVLCAHLDHLGTDAEGTVFPGADDNASGSVALLALAEALVARGAYRRSVLFLWVSGEESGLWGSAAWCDRPRLPPELRPVAAFNLDMVGRDEPQELWLTPTAEHREHNALAALVPGLAPLEGFTELVSQDNYWSASDHFSFATRLRLPVVYLSSGEHDDYHRPTDTADRIDHGKLVRLVRLHLRLLEAAEGLAL
jgi:Zn-dependent M28 family amino/carboxypeptidase